MRDERIVETDGEGAVVLSGHPSRRFLIRENADGSILLQPVGVVAEGQYEYNVTAELGELLTAATSSPTVRRTRHHRG